MNDIIATYKSAVQTQIANLKEELKGIRTGRANPGIVEGMTIETYSGTTKMKLRDIATIANEGSAALIIVPFDPSTAQDIEKAIMTSPLGINPQREGSRILLRIPPLSEEQRAKYFKLVSQKIEETKNKIRFQRDEARKTLKRKEEDKSITEDMLYRGEKEIDQHITTSNTELQNIKSSKEKELMEV